MSFVVFVLVCGFSSVAAENVGLNQDDVDAYIRTVSCSVGFKSIGIPPTFSP